MMTWIDLDIFHGKVKFAYPAFIWDEFIEQVEDLCEKVNKYSYINECMNISLQNRSRSFFDL